MPGKFYESVPSYTDAYHTDGTHEWFGRAGKGATRALPRWQIFKMEYTGENWILLFPVNSVTGLSSDQPLFVWDNVETYTYRELGT